MTGNPTAADLRAITETQQATWATGDFNEIARQNMGMAETLCEAVDPRPGQDVIDLACGSGNAALVAARRYCNTTGLDYVPALIDRARARATAEGRDVDFRLGDAQKLPFPDATFDVVLSVYGVQFAPDQEKAAREMIRVCRPGGTIGLASPMPQGWSGDFFATHGRYNPPPHGVPSPLRWGTEDGVQALLGHGTRHIENTPRTALQYYRSIEHAAEVFRAHFGPTIRALEASAPDDRRSLLADLSDVFERHNRATDGVAVIENRYLQTIAVRA